MSDPDPVELLRNAAVLTDHPVDVGLRTEAAVLGRLVKVGYRVLVPFGVNQRYDLVIDVDGQFVRAQCKTGRMRNGVITFNTRSVRTNTRRTIFREYQGEADVFLVYCGATTAFTLSQFGRRCRLRCTSESIRPATGSSTAYIGHRTMSCPPSSIGRAPNL